MATLNFSSTIKQNYLNIVVNKHSLANELAKNEFGEPMYNAEGMAKFHCLLTNFQKLKESLVKTAILMKQYEKVCQKFKANVAHAHMRPLAPGGKNGRRSEIS